VRPSGATMTLPHRAANRCAAAGVVAACALAAPSVARSDTAPPRTIPSAPSEYVEVVPNAAGGASAGSPSPSSSSAAGSSSALGAASDAIAGGDESRLIGLGAVLLATMLSFVAVAARRRREAHEPKG